MQTSSDAKFDIAPKGLTFNDYVKMSIESGVPPLELGFIPIVNVETGYSIAYRTKTTINSIVMGVLPEGEYTYVSDKRPCGEELLKHNIQHAINAYRKFAKRKRNVEFISVRCPSELVENADLFQILSEILKKNSQFNPRKLLLEFPADLFDRDTEKAKFSILDLKVMHVKTGLCGCAAEDFPLAKLATVSPDYVILDPSATAWAGSRNKPRLLDSLIAYIQSMGVEVIAEGTEEERKAMRMSDCAGFTVLNTKPLTLDEALNDKEADEE